MLLTLALLATLHAAPAADTMPGRWQITGDVVGNAVKVICVIKQDGAALTGNCSDENTAPMPITGEAKDGKITFQYVMDYQGQPLTIIYSGTLSATEMKGTIDVRPVDAAGTFTAVPAPAKP